MVQDSAFHSKPYACASHAPGHQQRVGVVDRRRLDVDEGDYWELVVRAKSHGGCKSNPIPVARVRRQIEPEAKQRKRSGLGHHSCRRETVSQRALRHT